MSIFHHLLRWHRCPALALGLALLASGARGDEPAYVAPPFRFSKPWPVVLRAATAAQMPVSDMATPATRQDLRPEDQVTALVSHRDDTGARQWLVQLVNNALKAKERTLQQKPLRLYTNTGHEIVFTSDTAAIAIHVLGPFSANGQVPPEDHWSGTLANAQFLAFGLDRTCATLARLRRDDPEKHFNFSINAQPFRNIDLAANQRAAAERGFTLDDERAIAGAVPALVGFFQIVSRPPGLDSILFSVLDVPWWSIVRHAGKPPTINFVFLAPPTELDPQPWGLPAGTRCYAQQLLLQLNQQPALVCQIAVTAPRPPLLVSAGIIGIAATRPDGKGPRLMIRVIATRAAPESPARP